MGGRDFPHLSRSVLRPTLFPVHWVQGLSPGVKSGRGVTLTPHPFLVPLVMKEYSYTSTLPMDRTACTEPQCLYKGDLYLYFILVGLLAVKKIESDMFGILVYIVRMLANSAGMSKVPVDRTSFKCRAHSSHSYAHVTYGNFPLQKMSQRVRLG